MTLPKLAPRQIARFLAVQGLYQWQVNPPQSVASIEDCLKEFSNNWYEHAQYELLHFLLEHASSHFNATLNSYIAYSKRNLSEVQPIEKAILVIAAVELEYSFTIPTPVIINEAINLAKCFGGQASFKFINSLVDKLAKHLRSID